MSITEKSKKTAVQVIIDFINENGVFKKSNDLLVKSFDTLLTEAALLEKQQIQSAFESGMILNNTSNRYISDLEAEKYYQSKYKID